MDLVKKKDIPNSVVENFKIYKEYLSLDLLYNPFIKESIMKMYTDNVTISTYPLPHIVDFDIFHEFFFVKKIN